MKLSGLNIEIILWINTIQQNAACSVIYYLQ